MRTLRWLPFARKAIVILLAPLALGTSGCVSSMLANKIVRAPNLQTTPLPIAQAAEFQLHLEHEFYSLTTKVHVEPDPADLSVAVLEPGDYHFKHELKVTPATNDTADLSFHTTFGSLDKSVPPVTPRGTLVLLHGIFMTKESMLHWAFFLAQKGYRIVLVDLRGHGQSTGKVITYGARETGDLSQVLDELSRRQLIAGRVGVLGLSYGGAIAIQWAAKEPRVEAVVALAPFSDARQAIGEFGHALMPTLLANVSPETMTHAFALAAERGHFTWEQVDVLDAAKHLREPILLIHGQHDDWVPIHHSEAIRAAAPAGSRLLTGQGNHLTLSVRLDPIADRVAAWFDRALVTSLRE